MLLVVALGVLFALPIAWFNLRGHILNSLQSESRGGTATRSVQRLRNGFIVAQIVLAFVLLVGAGLLGISLQRAMSVSPGFRADHVLTGRIVLPAQTYPNDLARLDRLERLLERLRPQPGISVAGAITALPVHGREGDVSRNAMTVPGHVPEPGRSPFLHYRHGVSGEYFAVMGIPLIEGRFLENSDSRRDARVRGGEAEKDLNITGLKTTLLLSFKYAKQGSTRFQQK